MSDAPSRPPASPWRNRILRVIAAAAAGALVGYLTAWQVARGLPPIEGIPELKVVTRILDTRGNPIQSFGSERRSTVRFEQVSPWFFKALIASEDANFYQHRGVEFWSILKRQLLHYTGLRGRAGGSTITQQLAKNLFLTNERTLTRKLREMALAVRIEKTYTKHQILEMYGNLVNFGHARYGVEEASRFYFGKHASELTVTEAALLAGIVQLPAKQSPLKNPERALARRKYVLLQLAKGGAITQAVARKYADEPLDINPRWASAGTAPHFNDEVRRQATAILGDEALMNGGLDIYTTLDPGLQRLAEKAVAFGLGQYERRRGFRREELQNLDEDELDPKRLDYPEWDEPPGVGDFTHAIVERVTDGEALLRIGPDAKAPAAKLLLKQAAWTGCKKLTACLKKRDIVFVQIKGPESEENPVLLVSLEQEPRVNAAFVVIDNQTGAVRAMVGGSDYSVSKFNRAIQARRQTGSTMKALMYAGALEAGATPALMLTDTPTSFLQDGDECRNEYAPKNSDRKYRGAMSMRNAFEDSVNIPSVELLAHTGYLAPLEVCKQAGITTRLRPYPSVALGSFDVSLLEMTSAFTIFPTGGTHTRPFLIARITDRDGRVRHQAVSHSEKALSPQTAAVATGLLRGVIQHGTAYSAAALGQPLAGKTGTTDDYSNAWFIGFTPALTAGAWVGFDNPKSLGRGEVGAVAALPIWIAFMRDARLDPVIKGAQFPEPPGLTRVLIDRRTGLRAAIDSHCREEDLFEETFSAGTEPAGYCSERAHLRASLPPMMTGFDFDDELRLLISPAQLQRLLDKYAGFFSVDAERTRLTVAIEDRAMGTHRMELRLALTDEPVAGAEQMGGENWKCGQRTLRVDSKS